MQTTKSYNDTYYEDSNCYENFLEHLLHDNNLVSTIPSEEAIISSISPDYEFDDSLFSKFCCADNELPAHFASSPESMADDSTSLESDSRLKQNNVQIKQETTESPLSFLSESTPPPKETKRGRSKSKQSPATKSEKAIQKSKAHSVVEKRYRLRLQAQLDRLRSLINQSVPTETQDSPADDGGHEKACGKTAILRQACEYIVHLQGENMRLESEVEFYKSLNLF